MIVKYMYNIGLKTLLVQGISKPILYGDFVHKIKGFVGKPNDSDQFKRISEHYKKLGITWIACGSLHAWM